MVTLFTEGGRRVLELAASLARQTSSTAVEPPHLLWALALDESRGGEILQQHGLDESRLAARWPLPGGTGSRPPGPPGTEVPVVTEIPPGDHLQQVLIEARQHVANLGRHVEIGTEHLLLALTLVDHPVREFLAQAGLGSEAARSQTERHTGVSAEPLDAGVRLLTHPAPVTDQTDLHRILDASSNRAREGLRVIEDFVRFALDDRHLTEQVKNLRHRLTEVCGLIPAHSLLAARDTRGDVGTGLHSRSEMQRPSLQHVVQADFKRVEEACRSLEEYGKGISGEFSRAAGDLRYRTYTLERAVLTTAHARERLLDRDVYLILTESLCRNGSGPVLKEAMAAGVGIVQIREKQMSDRDLLAHARRIREKTAENGVLLIMNDRPDLAVLVDADGVHVGQEELPVAEARRIVGPRRIVGVSTHSLDQAREAVLDGADCIGIGPVFPTSTKSFRKLAGLEYVAAAAREITLPGFCIGGITSENVAGVLRAGARRIAVSSAICSAEDPGEAAARLIELVRSSASEEPLTHG